MAQPIADSRDLLVRGAAQLGLAVDTAGVERLLAAGREALLLVCIALEGMSDPHAVLAFSGEGPQGGRREALRSCATH